MLKRILLNMGLRRIKNLKVKAARVRRALHAKGISGRQVWVHPDDTFIVSYPKSGNTWTRFMVGNLISLEKPVTFETIGTLIPDIYRNSAAELLSIPQPRILKSHQSFEPLYPSVIYIVRDPRDVIVSFYHYSIKIRRIDETCTISNFLDKILLDKAPAFGSWSQNVESWLAERGDSNRFLLLRYEGMLEDPVSALRKVADFLAIEADEKRLATAVGRSSAHSMRKLEQAAGHGWQEMQKSRMDKMFVRCGKQGNWMNEMTLEDVEKLENAWGATMTRLGYDLASR